MRRVVVAVVVTVGRRVGSEQAGRYVKIFPVPSRFRVSTRRGGGKGPALALAGLALICFTLACLPCFTFILHSFNLGTFPSRIHRLPWPGLWPGRC